MQGRCKHPPSQQPSCENLPLRADATRPLSEKSVRGTTRVARGAPEAALWRASGSASPTLRHPRQR
eukprot:1795303-Pyramimonas_sp.AAC.1